VKESQDQSGALLSSGGRALTKSSSGLVRRGLDELLKLPAENNASALDLSSEPSVPSVGIDPVKDAPRRQHYFFAHQYLRERAQQVPKLLVANLRKESGTRYLSSLWVTQGFAAKREEDDFIPADGLKCFPIEIGNEYYGALVQFPTPQKMTEAYFAAIILPVDETASPPCEFFTLEFSLNNDRSKTTVLGLRGDTTHFNLGSGPLPDKEAFLGAINKLVLNRPEPLPILKPLSPERARRAESLTAANEAYQHGGRKGLGEFLEKQREQAQAREECEREADQKDERGLRALNKWAGKDKELEKAEKELRKQRKQSAKDENDYFGPK
jgi:hypothetical protein